MRRLVFVLILPVAVLFSQGPTLSYLADPSTQLAWAECRVYLAGGSQHKIPFLPVVNAKWAPCGTERYTRDIRVDAPILFVGDGAVRTDSDPYLGLDVAGKAVMFSYDFPDSAHPALDKEVTFEDRIRAAAARKAGSVVVFSWAEEYPFPRFRDSNVENVPEIPVIAINRHSAELILASGGLDAAGIFKEWRTKGVFKPQILISRLALRIDGQFDRVSTANFDFCFEREKINPEKVSALAATNEKSVSFLLDLFKAEKLKWRKTLTVYFRDYDSKLFYTHHWGKGASSDAGIFMVFDGSIPNFGLTVHENAHSLIGDNWGGSSSFLSEGFGKYAEAMATDPGANDGETTAFLRQSKLVPLQEMLTMNIGSDPRTEVAYPAAGSFIGYLLRRYSLAKVTALYMGADRIDIWTDIFGATISELESNWRASLTTP